jgi:hypothetical protein
MRIPPKDQFALATGDETAIGMLDADCALCFFFAALMSASVGSTSGFAMPLSLLPWATSISAGSGKGVNAVTAGRLNEGQTPEGSGRLCAVTSTT